MRTGAFLDDRRYERIWIGEEHGRYFDRGCLLLAVGGMAGWFLRKGWWNERVVGDGGTIVAEVQTASEKELIRLKEDKEAFDVLMGYNIDMIMGLTRRSKTMGQNKQDKSVGAFMKRGGSTTTVWCRTNTGW